MAKKTIGIVGGMGPEATAYLFLKIVRSTPAVMDQEHLHVLIDSDPSVPDRTDAILHGGVSPIAKLISIGKNLVKMGADFLVMPCNTAHYYIDELRKELSVPFLSMIEETFLELKRNLGPGSKIGILATDGTLESGVYDKVIGGYFELIRPIADKQREVMDAIYKGVKAGNIQYAEVLLKRVLESLISKGCKAVVEGCTEIPIALDGVDIDVPLIDTLEVLAKASVRFAIEGGENV